jgi:hypothetical protein
VSEAPGEQPLLLIRGDATDEEVAALVAVVHGMAAAGSLATASEQPEMSAWAAPVRKLRATHPHGPGGWRASALPR